MLKVTTYELFSCSTLGSGAPTRRSPTAAFAFALAAVFYYQYCILSCISFMNIFEALEKVSGHVGTFGLDPLLLLPLCIGIAIVILIPITWIWWARTRSFSWPLTFIPAVLLLGLGYALATSDVTMLGIYMTLLLTGIIVSSRTHSFLLFPTITAIGISALWNFLIDSSIMCTSLWCPTGAPVVYQPFPELISRCSDFCGSTNVIGLSAAEFFTELLTILLPGLVYFSVMLLYYWSTRRL